MVMTRSKLEELFSIDLRSLALFRICLGLIILFDLAIRLTALEAHYTDDGVLPRALLYEKNGVTKWWYIHYISGRTDVQALIFAIHGLFGLALLVGYHTWIVTAINWYLTCSLYARNNPVLQGGDVLLLLLIFWSLFLPLGAKWSVDAWRKRGPPAPERVFSGGSAAMLMQVALVYVFAVILKLNPAWLHGESVYFAVSLDSFSKPLGVWLRQFYPLLVVMNYVVFSLEALCPLLAFSPYHTSACRIVAVFLASAMHLGFDQGLTLGSFAYISVTSWTLFIPSAFWHWIDRKRGVVTQNIGTTLRGNRFMNWIAILLIVYVIAWNIRTVNSAFDKLYPRYYFDLVGRVLHLQQMWSMFEVPLLQDGWFVVAGQLANGSVIDLQRGGAPLSWARPSPSLVSDTYIDQRWRKYFFFLLDYDRSFAPYYGKYLCRRWNRAHTGSERLKSLQVVYMTYHLYKPPRVGTPHKIIVWNENCEEVQ